MRFSFVLQFVVLIVIGCGVYNVANHYQMIERQVKSHEFKSEQERENIRVLQAEWAYLTNPVRLEKIASEHFQLVPVDGSQMVAMNTMPLREALDAQETQTNIATNDKQPSVTTVADNLPAGVTPVVSQAMPTAAALPPAQNLPPLAITPVSDQRGVQ